jgi:cellulose synthase/poly-beta-1,6-N-acetylglucosamine synthase-like glycosyltransferase
MRPISIPANIQKHNQSKEVLQSGIAAIRAQLQKLYSPTPEVSIVIPAYNEAENILKTLSSLAASTTRKSVEIIVVNNNSKDETEALSTSAGATCIT